MYPTRLSVWFILVATFIAIHPTRVNPMDLLFISFRKYKNTILAPGWCRVINFCTWESVKPYDIWNLFKDFRNGVFYFYRCHDKHFWKKEHKRYKNFPTMKPVGYRILFARKTRISALHRISIMAVDSLVIQGARTSAAMVLTVLSPGIHTGRFPHQKVSNNLVLLCHMKPRNHMLYLILLTGNKMEISI